MFASGARARLRPVSIAQPFQSPLAPLIKISQAPDLNLLFLAKIRLNSPWPPAPNYRCCHLLRRASLGHTLRCEPVFRPAAGQAAPKINRPLDLSSSAGTIASDRFAPQTLPAAPSKPDHHQLANRERYWRYYPLVGHLRSIISPVPLEMVISFALISIDWFQSVPSVCQCASTSACRFSRSAWQKWVWNN